MNTILGSTPSKQSAVNDSALEITERYSILLRVLSLNFDLRERFSKEMVKGLLQKSPDFFQEAFELLIEASPAINCNDVAKLLALHPPLPGQWQELIARLRTLEAEDNASSGARRRGYNAALASLLAAWYDQDNRTSDVIWLVSNTRGELQSCILRALEGGRYEPRFVQFIEEFIFSEGIAPESLANAVAVILAGEGWCPKIEEWLSGLVLQVMTSGLEEFPYGELQVLQNYLFVTHDIPVPLQKVRKNEEPVYPLRSKVPEGINKYPFQQTESSDILNWNGYTSDNDDSNPELEKAPSQEVVDEKIISLFLPLLSHKNFGMRRELLYILKALVPSSVVLQDCALSLLKSENLDWVDCALFVLQGVRHGEVSKARELLAQNTDLFSNWLADEDSVPSVFDIIEELCIEGCFKELPSGHDFESASAGTSRFLGVLIQVKAANGLLKVGYETGGYGLEQYLRSSNQQILKGAVNACRYLDGSWNAEIEYLLRSIALDSNHPLWRDAAMLLQERKWKRESKEADRHWTSRRHQWGVPRWLYPLLPKIVSRAQEGHKPGFRLAFNAIRSSIDVPEVRRALLAGVVNYFRSRPMLVASPLSRLVSDELSIEEFVAHVLLK